MPDRTQQGQCLLPGVLYTAWNKERFHELIREDMAPAGSALSTCSVSLASPEPLQVEPMSQSPRAQHLPPHAEKCT
jgi:hypothetical protein